MVEGSVTSLGSQYLLSLRARNCRTGDVLDEEQAPAAKKEDVFKALGQMANRFQTWAGESLPRVEKEPSLSADVTTPSLEAWRSYSAAMKAQQHRATDRGSHPTPEAGHRARPAICDGLCQPGPAICLLRRVRTGSAEYSQGLRTTESGQRSGELFHHFQLPPAGNQKPGTGATDPGIVGATVSSGSRAPTDFWRPSRRRDPVITTKPWKKV